MTHPGRSRVRGRAACTGCWPSTARRANLPKPLLALPFSWAGQDLPPKATQVICFLACLLLRLPIMPTDIAQWVLDGHLPFLDLQQRTQPLVQASGLAGVMPRRLLRAAGAVPPQRLLRAVSDMATLLELQLPDVNANLLLLRLTACLELPQVCLHCRAPLDVGKGMHIYLLRCRCLHGHGHAWMLSRPTCSCLSAFAAHVAWAAAGPLVGTLAAHACSACTTHCAPCHYVSLPCPRHIPLTPYPPPGPLQPVFVVAQELHALHLRNSYLLHPHALAYGVNPYALLAALLFWALKLAFGLDGRCVIGDSTVALGRGASMQHRGWRGPSS